MSDKTFIFIKVAYEINMKWLCALVIRLFYCKSVNLSCNRWTSGVML